MDIIVIKNIKDINRQSQMTIDVIEIFGFTCIFHTQMTIYFLPLFFSSPCIDLYKILFLSKMINNNVIFAKCKYGFSLIYLSNYTQFLVDTSKMTFLMIFA